MKVFTNHSSQNAQMSDGIYPVFSFFNAPLNRAKNRTPDGCIDLKKMISTIRSGRYKETIAELRNMPPAAGEEEKAFSKRQQAFKLANLPAFTPWGVFSSRSRDSLVNPSWVACIDLDHIENPGDILWQLRQDSQLGMVAGFISPRGKGLKILIALEPAANIDSRYIQVLRGVQRYLDVTYHLPWDRSVETPNQACYLSYDPDAFVVENGQEIIPFNPDPWVIPIPQAQYQHSRLDDEARLINLVSEIKKTCRDITGNYTTWISIAFAIANTFGERGLQYFVDISRYYPGFNEKDATKKYLSCCHSSNHGYAKKCTLATVFYYAIQNGIDIASAQAIKKSKYIIPQKEHTAELRDCGNAENAGSDSTNSALDIFELAAVSFGPSGDFISSEVEERLPVLLRELASLYNDPVEKDIIIISSLVSLSSVIPTITGIYGDDRYSPHLFLFVVAEAGASKGVMKQAYHLVNAVHKLICAETQIKKDAYKKALRQYQLSEDPAAEELVVPPDEKLIVTANCSAAKFNQLLADNPNGLLMVETEGDTLANTFKREYGQFSETLRKAFHHEVIMCHLKCEVYEIEKPKLAVLLSGTPDQVTSLIHDPQNGLFSRFLFYVPEISTNWKTQRPSSREGVTISERVNSLGETHVLPLYQALRSQKLTFLMTENQWDRLDAIFEPLLRKCTGKLSGMRASVLRLGLILFRLSMTLTLLRKWEQGMLDSGTIVCDDDDFLTAESIVRICVRHTVSVLSSMKLKEVPPLPSRKSAFLERLPRGEEYDTVKWCEIAEQLNIPRRTAERYHNDFVKEGLVSRRKNGKFLIVKIN